MENLMGKFRFFSKEKIDNLPRTAGVYSFKNSKGILYIGKAANLKERVKNHFQQPSYRDNLFLDKIRKIGFFETGSEIEALLLEANLIKKYQPRYNVMWRDDKNYFWVEITKEKHPRVFITHQPKRISNFQFPISNKFSNSNFQYFGPFTDGIALKKTLRLLRKVFPYYTTKKHPKNKCLWCHLGLCPGPEPDFKQYKKDINNLVSVLTGKKQSVLKKLKTEMKEAAKGKDFEKAARLRDQIFSLEKIMEHAKVIEPLAQKNDWENTQKVLAKIIKTNKNISKIEGYDISNIQGQQATGSMVVFIDGLPNKNLYRKFKIRISGKPNDTAMIKEVLNRRLGHLEWPLPELMLIDGGIAQLNAALRTKNQNANFKKKIKILSLAKKNNDLFIEGRRKPIPLKTLSREIFNIILQIRDESHRFAVAYHHQLRKNSLN
jgi:excinuclease ABC subunit C